MMLNQILVSEGARNTIFLLSLHESQWIPFTIHSWLQGCEESGCCFLSPHPSELVSLSEAKSLRWESCWFTVNFEIWWRHWLVPLIKGASFPGEDAKVKTYGNKWELSADISLGIWPPTSLWLCRSARITLRGNCFAFWLVRSLEPILSFPVSGWGSHLGLGFLGLHNSNEVLGDCLFLNVLLEEQFECQSASCQFKNRGTGRIENSSWPCWEVSNTGQVYWNCREQTDFLLVFIGVNAASSI